MTVHVDEKRNLTGIGARARHGSGSVGRAGVALCVLAGLGLAGADRARAQPAPPAEGAASLPGEPPGDVPGAAAPAEPAELPLLDDSAAAVAAPSASAEPPAGADAEGAVARAGRSDEEDTWSRGVAVTQRQAARRMFLQANDAARKRFFATAAARYKQALQLWPHPAFAYNLALAQRQLDQPVEAHASLERAIAHGPAPLAGRYDQAQEQLAELETELAPLEVVCDTPGAHVMLNGKPLFTGPGRHRGVVRPGVHQLVATRRGSIPVVEQIVATPGEPVGITLELAALAKGTRGWRGWAAVSTAGAGVALLLAGGALDWHSSHLFDAYRRDFIGRCPKGCNDGIPAGLERRPVRAEDEQRAAMIAYAVGGAALVTGVVLTLLDRERPPRSRARLGQDAGARASPATVAPLVSPGVVGVSAGFRF